MAGLLEQTRLWAEAVIRALGYPGLALMMFIESVFPPLPSEVILPFAGFLAGRGELNLAAVVAAATAGSLAGALALYGLGRWAEDHVLLGLVRRHGRLVMLNEQDWLRALRAFDRFGGQIVFFGRLVPVIRSLVSIPAGMDHLPLGKFLAYTTLGSSLWNLALAAAGLALGQRWEQVIDWVHEYEVVFFGLAAAGTLALAGRAWLRRGQKSSSTDTEIRNA